jgi:hypothetical protein
MFKIFLHVQPAFFFIGIFPAFSGLDKISNAILPFAFLFKLKINLNVKYIMIYKFANH